MPDDGGGSVKRVYERLTKHHSQKQDYDVRNSCSSSDSLSDHVVNQKDNMRITKVDPSMVRPATKLVKNNDNNGVLFIQGNPFWMWKTRAERLAANKTDETDFTIPSAPQILKDLQDKHNNLPDAPLPLPRFNPWQDAIKMAKRDKTYFSKDNISNNIAYCLLLMDEKASNMEERPSQKLPFTEPNAFIEYKRDDLNQNKSVDWKPSGKGVCRKEKKKKGIPAPLPVAVVPVEAPKKRWRGFGLRVRGFAFRDKNSKKENKKSEREAEAAPGEVNVTPTSSSTRLRKQKEAKPPSPPKFIEPIEILRQSRAKQEEREHDNSSDPFFDPPNSAQDTPVMKSPHQQKSREEKSAEVSKSSESASAEADKRRKSADRSREKSKEADKSSEKPPAKVESQTRIDAQKEDAKKPPHNKESKKSNVSARSKKKKKPKKKVNKKKRLRDTLTEESMKTSKKPTDETKSDDGRRKESTKKKSTVKTSDED